MRDMEVRDIMSTELVTLAPDDDLSLADTIMRLARIRHLPVVQGGRLIGLVTHRDILRVQVSRLQTQGFEADEAFKAKVRAGEVMTREVTTITPETLVLDAARTIQSRKLGCLPVIDKGLLVGLVTEADFVSLVVQALENERGRRKTHH